MPSAGWEKVSRRMFDWLAVAAMRLARVYPLMR
jgi:hypothetical protein